jgi:hypothetical protein
MNKSISLIMAAMFFSASCFADCDFSKGITPGPNNTYVYTQECNRKVGQLVQDNGVKAQQVQDLNKAIQLKDLTIQKDEQRIQSWSDTSMKLEENIQKIDSVKKTNEWIYFALGVIATGLAGISAAQLSRSH